MKSKAVSKELAKRSRLERDASSQGPKLHQYWEQRIKQARKGQIQGVSYRSPTRLADGESRENMSRVLIEQLAGRGEKIRTLEEWKVKFES